MIIPVLLIICALAALLFLLRAVRNHGRLVHQVDDLAGQLRPVDLEAFRNLMDPEEEEFLRISLPPAEFRRIQRARLRAALEYVACAAHNATVLLSVGTEAVQNPDPRVSAAGQQLMDNAFRLRWFAMLALGKLYVGVLLPGARISPASVADMYQQLSTSLTHLGRVQFPSRGARISAAT